MHNSLARIGLQASALVVSVAFQLKLNITHPLLGHVKAALEDYLPCVQMATGIGLEAAMHIKRVYHD
jgi:hypothetical protein